MQLMILFLCLMETLGNKIKTAWSLIKQIIKMMRGLGIQSLYNV